MELTLQRNRPGSDVLLKRFSKVIPHISDLDKFLKLVVNLITNVFGISHASLLLIDDASGKCILKVSTNSTEENLDNIKLMTIESGITWTTRHKHSLFLYKGELLKDVDRLALPQNLLEELQTINSHICVPLITREKLVGMLNIGSKTNNEIFTSEDLRLLSTLTDYLAAIIDHAFYHKTIFSQREHHRNILDNITCATITIDTDGKVTTFNRSAEAILGFKSRHVLGKNIQMIQGNLANLILDTLHTGKTYRREEIHILPENMLIGVSTSRLYSDDGDVSGAVMVFTNLLEIKYAEKEMERKNKNIFWNKLSTSLSHEIKNSLVTTKTFLQLFPEKYTDTEFRENFYNMALQDIKRLDKFVEKISKFAQLFDTDFKTINLHDTIDDVLFSMVKEQSHKNITFIREYAKDVPSIMANCSQLSEVFNNLIINGIEAMHEGGTMTISTELENGNTIFGEEKIQFLSSQLLANGKNEFIKISFTDTGDGIPKEDISKIFEPFSSTKKGRASLGLAIVSKIIENHKGFIKVESTLNEGTTFSVYLPVGNS